MTGHVTGQFRGGSLKLERDGGTHNSLSRRSPDLAKLNPDSHMNYSIIFTEKIVSIQKLEE